MQTKRLADAATIVAGINLGQRQTPGRTESFSILSLKDVGRELAPRETLAIVQSSRAEVRRCRIAPGDVVVTTRGTDIRAAVVQSSHSEVIAGVNLAIVRPDAPLDPILLAAFLREPRTQARLLRDTAGASTPGFTLKALGDLPISIPSVEHQRSLVRFIQAAEAHRAALLRSIELREQVCNELVSVELTPTERTA